MAFVAVVFAAAFVMVFWGDPEFPPLPEPTPADMAAFAARFEQPYLAGKRQFEMRDGVTLAAQDFEAKFETTIVFVHGVLSGGFLHNRSSGLLREAASAEVIAIDLRGHGASGGAPGDVSYIGQYEDDVADVIREIRAAKPAGRIILAGHSMGGGIALRYAMKPGAPPVDGYLLFAPHLGPKSPTTPTEATEAGAAFVRIHLPRILGLTLFNTAGIQAFNGLHTLFFNLPKELPLRSYSYRAMVGMHPADHAPALAAVDKPLLVMVGSKDEAFRADRYEDVIRQHSRGEVVIVEGASHDGVVEDPRALAAVQGWIGLRPQSQGR
ncbi:MAG TPA: alpha/beta fold hydrolase [Thermoanaerobaculia bacterium]|nr:alpha/beta fold hydrolase [Thermoanaerobaculia bacterium]